MGPTSVQRLYTFIAIFRCNSGIMHLHKSIYPDPSNSEIFAQIPSRSRLGLHFKWILPFFTISGLCHLPSFTHADIKYLNLGFRAQGGILFGMERESPISWSDLASMDSHLPKRRTDTYNMNFPRQYSVKSSHH